jgi:hypothetical protein
LESHFSGGGQLSLAVYAFNDHIEKYDKIILVWTVAFLKAPTNPSITHPV